MTIKVTWEENSTSTIRFDFGANSTFEEFIDALNAYCMLTDGMTHTVNALMDLSRCSNLPSGVLIGLRKLLRVMTTDDSKILIIGGQCAHTLANTFYTTYSRHMTRLNFADNTRLMEPEMAANMARTRAMFKSLTSTVSGMFTSSSPAEAV